MVDESTMTPVDEYEAELARAREEATRVISRQAPRVTTTHFLGILALVVAFFGEGYGGAIYWILSASLFLYSIRLAIILTITTFRAWELLGWRWRARGFIPWCALCLESILLLIFMEFL